MITGKQRSYLKKMVHALEPTVYMGKAGLTENVLQEMDDYLRAHELLKVKLQDGCVLDSKEAANAAAEEFRLRRRPRRSDRRVRRHPG